MRDFKEIQEILELQKKYKNKEIAEDEMTEEQVSKLIILYKSQNETLKENLNRKLYRLKTLLDKYSKKSGI